ncbi:hypothetical protein [Umezawaea sp. Da 62-37]|uniref:hypothetical protein n=1 Tax=Umezawaea sp. Da 62-37 TaxID=3075927 RepID=UPI0028F704B3|nr:hypothetical protein [Umezawaea sp. Da 62-37]WNV82712.1 hypothetical protein RM788_31515 [Umezawaea sp. Da 62-37]
MTSWTRIFAVAGSTAMLGLALTGVASADETPTGPAPMTVSADQVKKRCEERVPKIEARIKAATDRIGGDENTRGSTKWLEAQAKAAREAGKDAKAKLFDARKDLRGEKLTKLGEAQKRIDTFQSEHCGYPGGTK